MDDPATPPPGNRHGLIGVLVSRPVTVLMLFLTLVGTGVLAYKRIPLTLLPQGLVMTTLNIYLPYPGAGPQEVLDQLARPVEDAVKTIPGIKEVMSFSQEGSANVNVTFGGDADMDLAYGEVRDRIERIRGELPSEMDRYFIFKFDPETDIPVAWIGVRYNDEAEDPFGPIERIVVPRLEAVDGVARVRAQGIVDEVVRIYVDMDKVRGYGIDLGSVIQAMQQDNFTLPAGKIDDAGREFALRIDARFTELDEIQSYPVGNGRVLADIAEISPERAWRDSVWRINGRAAVGMSISKESGQNTIDVCTAVEEAVAELEHDPRLKDIQINVFWTQKEEILRAIGSLQSSGMWGGVFAVVVLFFFLRNVRLTLIAALAIPSSLLAALMAVYFSDLTLNLLTLVGFTLAIGMLVDNTIVVIENIARKRAEGADRREAAGWGAAEVGLAVVTATLTSVVVFLPLMFIDAERNIKVFVTAMAMPITYALLASLLVAIVFIPVFTSRLLRQRKAEDKNREMSPRLIATYHRVLSWVLDHRLASTLVLIVVVNLAMSAGAAVPKGEEENEEGQSASMNMDFPSNYTLADANAVVEKLEDWADENMEDFGYDVYSAWFTRRNGDMEFWAKDDITREQRLAMADKMREGLPRYPGVELTIGRSDTGGRKEVRVVLNGPDFGVLAELAEELKPRLAAMTYVDDAGEVKPLLENVKSDVDRGLDEVHVRVDRERASELGVAPETVQYVVAWGLGGQRLPELQVGEREVRVQIEYAQSDEESLEFLRNISLPRNTGGTVPLVSVADLSMSKSVGTIVRRDNRTSMSVTANPNIDNIMLTSAMVANALSDFSMPEGYSWTEEGGLEEFEADMGALTDTLIMSVVLVYLLMAILLESVVLPLSTLLSIPLALMGVNFALAASGYTMGPMVVVGMILLAGIVVNNAIVLLDKVQRLRQSGLDRREALIQGGRERLRPILMTALTTIFGLMPMAMPTLFPGGNAESGYESMAVTVAGGLAFSTFFTLLIVPLFYTFFDDIGNVIGSLLPRRQRPERIEPAGAEPGGAAAGPIAMDRRDAP